MNGRALLKVSVVTAVGVSALFAGLGFSRAVFGRPDPAPDYAFMDPIIDVYAALQQRYVEPVDTKALQQGAISGMLDALNDPYTMYVPPVDKNEFSKELLGEYVGIGAMIVIQDQWLTIVSPLEDSPAIRAGIMPGDRVKEIDGKSTFGLTDTQCIKLLTGEQGTPVRLLIERKGETIAMEIVRDHIKTKSVKGFHRDDADATKWNFLIDPARAIAYVRLTQFTPQCSQEIDEALRSVGAHEGRIKGLILDLRGNPGGVLSEAEAIADMFLPSGVIVSTRGRAIPEKITRAQEPGTYPDFPIALLINGSSASASEVLAGALIENNRAIAIGTRTFGKGSVQTVETLRNAGGAQLKFTEQGYFLPSGRSITRKDDSPTWGVDPSDGFFVSVTDKELLEMLLVRREEEVIRTEKSAGSEPKNWADPAWIVSYLKDRQLSAAVSAVQQRVDTGEWKPTGETSTHDATIAGSELGRLRVTHDRLLRELARLENRMGALESAAEGGAAATPDDLIPDGAKLNGGKLEIFDKDGTLIATLKLTDDNLERWLMDAGVEKVAADVGNGAAPAEPPTGAKPPVDPVK